MDSTDIQFINKLKSVCDKNISFIEEVAFVLEINYDAAYRRVKGKTQISLSDAIKLSKHFKVSINQLYDLNKGASEIMISKTQEIKNVSDLEKYFDRLSRDLSLLDNEYSSIFYSAKDLPIFYVLQDNLLSRFKLYVWLYILDTEMPKNNIPFEKFKLPNSLIRASQNTGRLYNNIKITEQWNYGVINSVLNQIKYFFELKLLSYKSAMIICEDLIKTMKRIEESSHLGKRFNEKQTEFNLYYNELLILNNNAIVTTRDKKTLFSPYSLLRYYKIEDQTTCNTVYQFFMEQLNLSTLLSKSGVKERILFFKPKYQQIEFLIKELNHLKEYPIFSGSKGLI
jgi:plasmid maintenance system antidote protein VapI